MKAWKITMIGAVVSFVIAAACGAIWQNIYAELYYLAVGIVSMMASLHFLKVRQ